MQGCHLLLCGLSRRLKFLDHRRRLLCVEVSTEILRIHTRARGQTVLVGKRSAAAWIIFTPNAHLVKFIKHAVDVSFSDTRAAQAKLYHRVTELLL